MEGKIGNGRSKGRWDWNNSDCLEEDIVRAGRNTGDRDMLERKCLSVEDVYMLMTVPHS